MVAACGLLRRHLLDRISGHRHPGALQNGAANADDVNGALPADEDGQLACCFAEVTARR
jgi:hypothetical protein